MVKQLFRVDRRTFIDDSPQILFEILGSGDEGLLEFLELLACLDPFRV